MKVILGTDFYHPFIGGAERQGRLLGHELASRGYEVHVVTPWHQGQPALEQDHGVTVHRMKAATTLMPWFSSDPKRRFHPPFPDPLLAWRIRRLIKTVKPDLVHSSGWVSYSCAAAVLGTRTPLLISVRDYGFTCAKRILFYKGRECTGPSPAKCLGCASSHYGTAKGIAAVAGVYAGRPLLQRSVTAVHSVSTFVQRVTRRDLLKDRPIDHKASVMVPDFVIPSFLEDLPTSDQDFVRRLPNVPFILFVGALQAHKGIYELVAAYAKLRNAPPMVMIGTKWPDTPTTFPQGITVHHNVDHSSVMASWERSLFGVVPTIMPESLGGVSLEAMSMGKAVVASAIGGIVDIVVDGETGLLVPPGDATALATAMQRLIDDPDLRARLGAGGRDRVRLFTADKVVPRYEQLYREILAGMG